MAEKILNTRIALKIDTLENWNKSDLILKKGELAFATVAASVGNGLTEPVIMVKVGNGNKKFSELNWNFHAKASDVLAACKSEETLTTFVEDVITNSKLATSAALTELAGRVTAAEGAITILKGDENTAGSVAKSIKDAIDALSINIAATYVNKTDYAVDKAALEKAINDEKARAEGVEGGLRTDVDAIKGDYLKGADKTALEDKITAEETRATNVENGLKSRIETLEGYFGEEGEGTVAEQIADAVAAETDAREKAIKAIDEKIGNLPEDATATTVIGYVDEKVGAVASDLADYETANNAALAEVKATAEAARTEDEVNSQIDTKISALNLATTYEPIGAEDRAKQYVDGKFTDANLDQYTTEQEVKDIVDAVVSGAVEGDTITGLANLVEYINTHGGEAAEMASAIDVLEGKVDTLEKAPAAGILATDIEAWNAEKGAKALAETKLDASAFTTYEEAHKNDYTNKQIDDAIDADVSAAITAEVTRADGAYDAKGAAATAKSEAIADAATKYETIGTAQGIVDALDLENTYASKAQGAKADSALQKADIATGNANGTISVKGEDVVVKGLGSAAYTDDTAYDAAGAAAAVETKLIALETNKVDVNTQAISTINQTLGGYGDVVTHNAADFATAAQGALANTAIQNITAPVGSDQSANGLKVERSGNNVTIGFDPDVVFVFDCGNSGVVAE